MVMETFATKAFPTLPMLATFMELDTCKHVMNLSYGQIAVSLGSSVIILATNMEES